MPLFPAKPGSEEAGRLSELVRELQRWSLHREPKTKGSLAGRGR
jgi:hypothetical protein